MSETRFDGWRVVAGAFILLGTTSGLAFYNLGLYLTALKDEHGFSEGPLSLATVTVFALGGVLGIPIGAYIQRSDPRRLFAVGAAAGAISLYLLGSITEIWQIYASYALLALGFATAGLVPTYSIVTRWFDRRRAVAMSIASTGLSTGGIVFTPLFEWVIDEQGLDGAAPWLAIAWVVGIMVPTLFLIRPDPISVGQHPDGVAPTEPSDGPPQLDGWDFEPAVRTNFFLTVSAAYILVMGSQVGGIVHIFNLVDGRVGSDTAATAVSIVAFSSIIARLLGGFIATRVALRPFTIVFCFVQAAGLLLLGNLDGNVGLLAAAAVFGASVGNLLMLQPLLLSGAFGARNYPRIYARANAITAIGLVTGPAAIGILKDALDSYRVPYALAALAAAGAGLVLAVLTRDPETAGGADAVPAASAP
ncbi:MAG: MFS transporter [Actinomycetota bacterium]